MGQGSKTTTFQVNTGFGIPIGTIKVHFSWDSNTWKPNEEHTVALTIELTDTNDDLQDLSVRIDEIRICLKDYHTEPVIEEDLRNQINYLITSVAGPVKITESRSYSYTVQISEEQRNWIILNDLQAKTVKLYYLIELNGNYEYASETSHANGSLYGTTISNEGILSGGIEDPVWITLEPEQTLLSSPYLIGAIIGASITAIASATIVLINKKRKSGQSSRT